MHIHRHSRWTCGISVRIVLQITNFHPSGSVLQVAQVHKLGRVFDASGKGLEGFGVAVRLESGGVLVLLCMAWERGRNVSYQSFKLFSHRFYAPYTTKNFLSSTAWFRMYCAGNSGKEVSDMFAPEHSSLHSQLCSQAPCSSLRV